MCHDIFLVTCAIHSPSRLACVTSYAMCHMVCHVRHGWACLPIYVIVCHGIFLVTCAIHLSRLACVTSYAMCHMMCYVRYIAMQICYTVNMLFMDVFWLNLWCSILWHRNTFSFIVRRSIIIIYLELARSQTNCFSYKIYTFYIEVAFHGFDSFSISWKSYTSPFCI